jgi:hypothetical protein
MLSLFLNFIILNVYYKKKKIYFLINFKNFIKSSIKYKIKKKYLKFRNL